VLDSLLAHPLPGMVENALGRLKARVGADQNLLQLLPELFGDAGSLEDADDTPKPRAPRALDGFVGALSQLLCILDIRDLDLRLELDVVLGRRSLLRLGDRDAAGLGLRMYGRGLRSGGRHILVAGL